MESILKHLFFHQWQRKLLAILTATIIWFFVSHTIISSKTIPSVPIRVINLPLDKTIPGLLPNGVLAKRMTITLSGTKDIIDQLEPGDIEIVVDLTNQPNEGIVQISKKNLVSLNPSFNLAKHVVNVTYPEFILKMSRILKDKIPVYIHPPEGKSPEGYEYLGIWPIKLMQTVSGPEEDVLNLKNQGLELTFKLNDLTKEQLDAIQGSGLTDDEVGFIIPESWKKITIPFLNGGPVPINDPDAKWLQISFLRDHFIPIKTDLPVHVFYPLKDIGAINPETYRLANSPFIQKRGQLPVLAIPLLANHVSKLFIEIIKNNMELEIIASPPSERETLEWSIGFIDPDHLEDDYVAYLLSNQDQEHQQTHKMDQEHYFRERFRTYLQKLKLFLSQEHEFEVESWLENGQIEIHIPYAQKNHAS